MASYGTGATNSKLSDLVVDFAGRLLLLESVRLMERYSMNGFSLVAVERTEKAKFREGR